MRVRHRVPMVFSLSMLDLFCCALGCVTLLWLVNQREAMLRARDSVGLQSTLTAARSDVTQLKTQIAATTDDKDKLARAAARLQADLDAARSGLDKLTKQLVAAITQSETDAARQSAEIKSLTRTAAVAKVQVADLSAELRDANRRLSGVGRSADELNAKLKEYEGLIAKLRATADMMPELRDSAAVKSKQLTTATDRVKSLEQELEALRQTLVGLDLEKKNLAGQLGKAKLVTENRFEGINLTGRRVIFLIDMSGSMDLLDPNTSAPDKWPVVRDTLLKLFKSLPDLEQFQVILFSDQLTYLMGNEGKWLDRDAQSAERIQAAMSATKPKGNTDMYMALDAVFRYRPAGLDTIYLLSDGLPNVGAGLSPEAAKTLSDTGRSDVLSRHVRQTLRTTWNAPQANRPRVKINAVGFFYESPDVGAFLWALARENDGSFVGMSKP